MFFLIMVLEKTLKSPLNCKKIQPIHPKGDQSWIFIGRTDVEAETPILWPPNAKSWLIWKDPDDGKDWRWEKGTIFTILGVPAGQNYGFSSNHVWMWELDHKESWALKNWCFWTMVLEKTLESLLDCKDIQPVHPKGNQSWIFIGRTNAEAETPIFWPCNVKN